MMIPREKYGIRLTQYKHDISTAKKAAKNFKRTSEAFGGIAGFCGVGYIVIFQTMFKSFPQTLPDFFWMFLYIAIVTLPVVFFARKALKIYAFAKEIESADPEESEFSKIDCTDVSLMRLWVYFDIYHYRSRSSKVQAFRLKTDKGEKYVLILNNPIPNRAACEIAYDNKDLNGTLYVRRYKGTNLLCEIKKTL